MSAPTPTGDGPTILVVDDDDGVRTVTRFILRREGYETIECTTGREAVDQVVGRGAEIGVVLLDLMMPDMTGPEALPLIRELQPGLPVVFFSGFDQSEVAEELVETSVYTSFLPKPYKNQELVDEIARALEHRR